MNGLSDSLIVVFIFTPSILFFISIEMRNMNYLKFGSVFLFFYPVLFWYTNNTDTLFVISFGFIFSMILFVLSTFEYYYKVDKKIVFKNWIFKNICDSYCYRIY